MEYHRYTKCRQNVEKSCLSFITKDLRPPHSLFMFGHTATGKTTCIQNVLNQQKVAHVIVQCTEMATPRLLYEHILSSLDSGKVPRRCDDMNSFVRQFKHMVSHRSENIFLVFEKAERLRSFPANVLPALLRLAELTVYPVCVILESELVWENFRIFSTGCYEPIIIHFPEYTKEDLVDILCLDQPTGVSAEFYRTYSQLVVTVFYALTRNLRELKHLSRLNYNRYRAPVDTGEIQEQNSRALYKRIEPQLRTAISTIYLHEVSDRQWESADADDGAVRISENHLTQVMELPYFSKYLLIAAYLASYNPATTDRRFFVKNAGKLKKTANHTKKAQRTSGQILGPKAFQLDRMMAIFYSIVEGKVQPTAQLYTQITNLVSLQLLSSVGYEAQFDAPKYRCLINLEFAKSISRSVGFEIMSYLYDFI